MTTSPGNRVYPLSLSEQHAKEEYSKYCSIHHNTHPQKHPDPSKTFVIEVDTSKMGVEAIPS